MSRWEEYAQRKVLTAEQAVRLLTAVGPIVGLPEFGESQKRQRAWVWRLHPSEDEAVTDALERAHLYAGYDWWITTRTYHAIIDEFSGGYLTFWGPQEEKLPDLRYVFTRKYDESDPLGSTRQNQWRFWGKIRDDRLKIHRVNRGLGW